MTDGLLTDKGGHRSVSRRRAVYKSPSDYNTRFRARCLRVRLGLLQLVP